MNIKENVFFRAQAEEGICTTHWCEQRGMDSNQQRQIVVKFNIPLFSYFYNHLSNYTTGSWIFPQTSSRGIFTNIHFTFSEQLVIISELSLDLMTNFYIKYCITLYSNYSLLTVRISFNSVLIFPTSFDSASVSDLNGRTGFLKLKREKLNYSINHFTSQLVTSILGESNKNILQIGVHCECQEPFSGFNFHICTWAFVLPYNLACRYVG